MAGGLACRTRFLSGDSTVLDGLEDQTEVRAMRPTSCGGLGGAGHWACCIKREEAETGQPGGEAWNCG